MSISHPSSETNNQATKLNYTKNSVKSKQLEANLATLIGLEKQAPFSTLIAYLDKVTGVNIIGSNLGADLLNHLYLKRGQHTKASYEFISQSAFESERRYYEEIIFEDKKIPTRENWHDFFNGLVWLQFPKTKRYFSELHNDEISVHGLKQRTPVRDRLIHFDECGLVLLTNQAELESNIAAHNWQKVFVENSALWHKNIIPIILGHALWEMLMNPFVGLTAKVKVVCLPHASDAQLKSMQSTLQSAEVAQQVDALLRKCLVRDNDFFRPKPWLPLPLLGIPNWSPFEQNSAFYANKHYFMPKR